MSGEPRPILALMAKLVMVPPRRESLQIEAAQRLAVEARDRADLDVEIDVLAVVLLLLGVGRPGERRFHEAAAVIDVAAQDHPQRAVRRAVGLQRGLVAVGEAEDREVRGHDVAGAVDLDRALDRGAGRLDHHVLEARAGRFA